ncbi:MAG: M23 family metallopeptidase [Chitinophagaceae bacterium]|jgi:murein DD-endopeptidase MepM/ murein hydrolase activator NlpD|nr:M23 family metallopeptidase [Chitinophagaceae bacterium]
MKKIKYYYNTHTLRYEKQVVPLRVALLRVLAFISTAIVTGLIIVAIAFRFVDSPKEKILKVQLERAEEVNKIYADRYRDIDDRLKLLERRDNEVYRSVFEATPIPDSARAKQIESKKELQLVAGMENSEMTEGIYNTLNTIYNRITNQEGSYKEIEKMIKNKEKLLASTPAIQPLSNRDLNRLSSGFGYRIDPVYKTVKFHPGLDFSAPQGTPIYATAEGTVQTAGNLGNGYGNHIVIQHGYSYSTLYGHMSRIKAKRGQRVKRGEVIGYVGSTGKSTGSHLHYEVFKGRKRLDPIYFFYNDLTPEQYQQILKLAASRNQSFD